MKSYNGLMKHLRESGIAIEGSAQKRQLRNIGYFHGYKGYRFFRNPRNRIPFENFAELYAIVQYDTDLKALFYSKIMFIETAVKSIALECILEEVGSESIQDMLDWAIAGYNHAPEGASKEMRQQLQAAKLRLQKNIQDILLKEYNKKNPKIAHYYNHTSHREVPLWALIEVMMLGVFSDLLSCLTVGIRERISKRLEISLASDTGRELVYRYLYTIKDLRNAIAHNDTVFDTRFLKAKPSPAMKATLRNEFRLPYVDFNTIGDFLILTCYYLKNLHVSKTEISSFIREFERITDKFCNAVSPAVAGMVIHPDQASRILMLKKCI